VEYSNALQNTTIQLELKVFHQKSALNQANNGFIADFSKQIEKPAKMATNFQFTQLSLIKINDFKGVVIRVYHFNNKQVIHFLPLNYLFFKGYIS
jgi:hypothetical protein